MSKDIPEMDASFLRTSLPEDSQGEENKTLKDDEVITKDKMTYFWKVFEFKNKTIMQAVDDHPYITNPLTSINREFSLFHLVS